ncbi:putative choline o-acyltransferase [Danaus plexippus plexippus]|uniref:Choline O-acetyltransferase n=1 Tax=Danaus plexippus plexippus TaxID=278856 RepID=A0A212FCP1_DANPL|nr:putative choline o-acyltransferase [Danaus plexippus plexippus]
MNTDDFFSLRRPASNYNYHENQYQRNSKAQLEKPVTEKPRQYVIRPMFDHIDGFNLRDKYFRPKPLLVNNDDFYREKFQLHHQSDAITLRQKINYVRDMMPSPVPKDNDRHVIERPSYLPPKTKPKFLRDRIDSIRNYLFNTDVIEKTQFPISKVLRDSTDFMRYEDPLYYYRKSEWWLDDMYLKIRLPVPINSNPGMVFPRKQFAKIDEVADLAALYVDDLLDYKEMLDRGELPQERATSREKGQPLCMEQFYRLLGVCRIPEVGKDRLELPPRPDDPSECEELIIVACRNYFYPIPVKAADRGRLTPGEIQAQILHAMVDAAGAPPAPRVGLLTAMNRDRWARAREQLVKEEANRANLELISRSLCVLCVDEAGGDRSDLDENTNALLRAMHGAGTNYHSANRWFDKTVQLIISSDGTVGMCYEHSPAEGVAVIRLAERALARADVAPRPAPPPALLPAPVAMKWKLTGDLMRTIEQAGRDFDRAILDLDLKVYTYRGYGREFMKSCRTSPDVYIQLALQYAYYKMYGYLVSTYESASLRRFHNGRVDNIRSAHSAALSWAAAMSSTDMTQEDEGRKVSFNLYGEKKKLELFEEATRKQTAIMEANIQGRGIDNHLLGLREAARETLGHLPDMFTDNTYNRMIEFKLSTSQVATTTEGTFMGYGAVVPDGYGCSYNPKRDSVIFCISSFASSSVTNTEAFRQALEEALDAMKLMFQNKKAEG